VDIWELRKKIIPLLDSSTSVLLLLFLNGRWHVYFISIYILISNKWRKKTSLSINCDHDFGQEMNPKLLFLSKFICNFFFFLVVLEFELRASYLLGSHSTTWDTAPLFCVGYFQERISQTICLGWHRMWILLISASQVTGSTDVEPSAPSSDCKFD
jgi:hypothetical protein